MKKLTKRILAAVLCVFMIGCLAACGSDSVGVSTVDDTTQSYMEQQMTTILTSLDNMSDSDIESYKKASDTFTVAAVTNYADAKDELGAFKEVISTDVDIDDTDYTVTSEVQYEKRKATVVLEVTTDASSSSLSPQSITFEAEYTLAESLERAALNTVMGVGVVFIILIFLSFLISLFKYVGKLSGEDKNVVEAPVAKHAAPVNPVTAAAAEEETDDLELIAVIAAAIAAAEETTTDSFVVRSIRKVNKNKWRNA